jgi:hypothetical protein
MDNPGGGFMPLADMLKNLNLIRDKLIEINEKNGSIANFVAMRKEIESIGWGGILQKYHPDINIDDPAAFPLFELYKFVCSTMHKKKVSD